MQNIFREFAWRMLCSIEIVLNKIHETLFFHQSATYWGHWSWPSRYQDTRKKKLGFEPRHHPSPSSTFSHLMTVFTMFYLSAVAFTLIFVIWISRQCPFIKVCRQSRKTFLLLYCLFFLISLFLLFYFFPTICVLRYLCHFLSDLSHNWPVGR